MNHLEAVLFDLDGTLIDTAPDFTLALNQLRVEHQQTHLPEDAIRSQVSNGARALIKLGFGLKEGETGFKPLLERLLDLYLANIAVNTRLFPKLDRLLKNLENRNIPWGIVTNKPSRFTDPLLDQLGLSERCGVTICPDHVVNRKPHPEAVLKACRELAVCPEKVFFVGDHARDIEAGNRAGNITIAAAWGYLDAGDDINRWHANFIINTPEQLVSFIEEHYVKIP